MNRPEKATRSHGKPSDDDDETTGLGLPVSLKRQIESYAVMHHMTPTQVLAEGMKLLLKQEALQLGRMNRAKPKARPCNINQIAAMMNVGRSTIYRCVKDE